MIAGAIAVSFIISITLVILNQDSESEKSPTDSRILFPKFCRVLASIISKTMSCGNSPLRPDGEDFSDGIEREIKIKSAELSPETHVMDIRKYMRDGQ